MLQITKGFSSLTLILIAATAIAGGGVFLYLNNLPSTPSPARVSAPSRENILPSQQKFKTEETAAIPTDLTIYQDYLETIGGKFTTPPQTVTIEGTVISIIKATICPDKSNSLTKEAGKCSIEPYPLEAGTVKINKVESQVPVSKNQKYLAFQEGQTIEALFLLTTQPVKVKYLPLSDSISGSNLIEQATSSNTLNQEHKFKPLLKESGLLVFITKMGNYDKPVEKILPGIKAGDTFTATAQYNGTLFIEEYQKLNP